MYEMMKRISCLLLTLVLGTGVMADEKVEVDPVLFSRDIASLLQENCLACHGPKKAEGGYRVDTFAELVKPGDSGEVPVPHGEQVGEELLRRLVTDDESERMPAELEPLQKEEIELVRRWIAEGAKFDGPSPAMPLFLVAPPRQFAPAPQSYAHPVPVTALVFTPDGQQVVSGGYHELIVWDAITGALVRRIGNLGQRIFSLAFDETGATLAVACGEPGIAGEIRLIDWQSGNVVSVLARCGDSTLDVAFRPASDQLAAAAADGSIRIVDWKTGMEVRTIASHADAVTAIAWSGDGKRLASASRDKSSKVFDVETGDLLASYAGHAAAVRGVAMTTDGLQVISVGGDNKLHRWEVEGAKKIAEVGLGGEAHRLVQHQDQIWIPCADHRVRRFDLSNNAIALTLEGHQDWVLSVAWSGTTGTVASADYAGQVKVWNAADWTAKQSWIAKP
jgi:hypothetical protein